MLVRVPGANCDGHRSIVRVLPGSAVMFSKAVSQSIDVNVVDRLFLLWSFLCSFRS